jgi:hypothetical protein
MSRECYSLTDRPSDAALFFFFPAVVGWLVSDRRVGEEAGQGREGRGRGGGGRQRPGEQAPRAAPPGRRGGEGGYVQAADRGFPSQRRRHRRRR